MAIKTIKEYISLYFIWFDAIHYKVKDGGKYVSKAVYTIFGIRVNDKKEVLGLLSEAEGANF